MTWDSLDCMVLQTNMPFTGDLRGNNYWVNLSLEAGLTRPQIGHIHEQGEICKRFNDECVYWTNNARQVKREELMCSMQVTNTLFILIIECTVHHVTSRWPSCCRTAIHICFFALTWRSACTLGLDIMRDNDTNKCNISKKMKYRPTSILSPSYGWNRLIEFGYSKLKWVHPWWSA